ncbi:ribonuclease HI [Anaerotalea alkaliphila]|uniref:Ribonuclease H n=1 Tax=Anaerotalea alkaliphila TaxID=2662126 RepID=A0A7X5KMV9_9FIRM|nr:ribonuclease HI [Anaerotalea alkaliphila]NDL66167.1 ribonuclease HI [Anaerotalea alkaliphila]
MEVDLYTDGACRGNPDGPGGYGALLVYKDADGKVHERSLSQGYTNTTNNRMELMAVLKGLETLKRPCHVTVHTDSQYIANAFNQGWLKSWIKNGWKRGAKKEPVKNEDLWRRILLAMKPHTVEYVWVRGHDGHPENERCDELATAAADGDGLLPDLREMPEGKVSL